MILLDNTVLSNFARILRPDLVLNIWGSHWGTTQSILQEYEVGIETHNFPAGIWHPVAVLELTAAEINIASELPAHLGAERSCIAIAINRSFLFACDDISARRSASRNGVLLTGTISILLGNVKAGVITQQEGNMLLFQMIEHGYRSPAPNLDDYL